MAQYIDTDRVKTKNEICALVEKSTNEFFIDMKLVCTANSISDTLFVSRSLASSYLNQLVKDNKVIKIVSRPVYFLDKKAVESHYSIRLRKTQFADIDEFREALRFQTPNRNDFLKMIGHNASLGYCINECIMALHYPPSGLPLLLNGRKGTGKKLLGRCMYEYALNQELIDNHTVFVYCDCRKSDDMVKLRRYITEDTHAFLYIDAVEHIDEDSFRIVERYFRENLTDKKKDKNIRAVFASNLQKEKLAKDILDIIPVHMQIPALKERPMSEKRALIALFFKHEERKLNKEIRISNRVLHTLMEYQFPENIRELKYVIKILCANAMIKGMEHEFINVYRYHLPDNIIRTLPVKEQINKDEENEYSSIEDIQNSDSGDIFEAFIQRILDVYQMFLQQKVNMDELTASLYEVTNLYFDQLIFDREYTNSKIETIQAVIARVMDTIFESYGIYLSANFSLVLTRIVYIASLSSFSCPADKNKHDFQGLLQLFEQYYPSQNAVAKELARRIASVLDIHIDAANLIGINTYLTSYNENIQTDAVTGIIISHGYSTASSIADASNRLLGRHIFEAIDMPLDMQVFQVAALIKKYIVRRKIKNNIILLVDMGSLESIGTYLKEIANLNIGVINNISTRIAISVGNKIMQGKSLHPILEETCREATTSYVIIKNQEKLKTIVFSTENGLISTRRLMELFFKSLPVEAGINLLCHGFSERNGKPEDDPIFQENDVILIIGSLSNNIREIPFISLEDIVAFENISLMKTILSNYLNEDEMNRFEKSLLNNFSLENIIGYLTILNPEKLLHAVEHGINTLAKMMKVEFASNMIIGLNIHICCMIERLVTKDWMDGEEQNENKEEWLQFKEIFAISFHDLEMQYGIKIPEKEIFYVYCYIEDDAVGRK